MFTKSVLFAVLFSLLTVAPTGGTAEMRRHATPAVWYYTDEAGHPHKSIDSVLRTDMDDTLEGRIAH